MRKKLTSIAAALLLITIPVPLQQSVASSAARAVQNGDKGKDNDGGRKCTEARLRGRYGLSYAGTIVEVGPYPISATGVITLDGAGHVSGTYVTNFGTVIEGNVTGTYTVNADCTGTAALDFRALEQNSNASFVVVDNGKEILFQSTDRRLVVTGVAKRL